jgi:hypothetical protein
LKEGREDEAWFEIGEGVIKKERSETRSVERVLKWKQ